ncbi:MAG TPA: flagellar basal body rod C-terminal domain-containing protein, partial [Defluviitoga tunisiensis]|nr:flagellar basal body rod C-terminal domain-containing protein [Defluviitoga tunisiensis]
FHPNTIQYVTSLKSYNSNPNIVVTDLTDLKLYSITGDTNSPSPFTPNIKYDSASKALYLDTAGDDLKDQLIIDFGGNFLKEYGFATKEIGAYKISTDDVVSGSIEFTIDDNTYTIDFNDNTDLINNINSGTGGYLKAVEYDGFIYIIPTNKVPNNDIDTIVLNNIEGSLSEMNAQKITLDALDVSKPTLNNLLGTNEKVEMSINGIKIEIDPLKDTANDLVEKINATNMGVTASITPHGKFVLRAGNFVDFDLANVVIKGNANLFDALGLIEDSSNNIITITSPDLSPDRIESMFSKADLLRIDKEIGLINQISVSQNLMSNPSLLAIDLGIFDGNNYQPIGAGSVTVWDQITQLRYSPILDNGRLGFSDFLANMITEIGVKGETAQKMKLNSESLNSQITIERERVMGVSIDEEVTNLIKYQQAFNACARVITAIDQMLSTVVSSMGVV